MTATNSLREPPQVALRWRDRSVLIEHCWVGASDAGAPLLVFLHEGLGSLSMWKDFPERLCAAAGCRGLVYSRPGYGRSTPRASSRAGSTSCACRCMKSTPQASSASRGVERP